MGETPQIKDNIKIQQGGKWEETDTVCDKRNHKEVRV